MKGSRKGPGIEMDRNMRKSTLLSICMLLCIIFCIGKTVQAEAASLSEKSITLIEGEKKTLKVKGAKGKVSWGSENKNVATVKNGVVTAKKSGTTYIRAKVSGKIYRCKVRVKVVTITCSVKAADKGDLVATESSCKASLTFKLNTTVKKATVYVCNSDGKKIKTCFSGKVSAGKAKTINWNLTNSKNKKVSTDDYYFLVKVNSIEKKSGSLKVYGKNDFAGGTGSKANPYQVKSFAQLKAVARHNNRYFVQIGNIDANYQSLSPLFSMDNPFNGSYDGKNYTISNLNSVYENNDGVGIFAAVGTKGTLKNLKVNDSIMKGNSYVGIIAGVNYGTVQNCVITSCNVAVNNDFCGGICGFNINQIRKCRVNDSAIMKGNYEDDGYVGGIAGYNKGMVNGCFVSESQIAANGRSDSAGGICGGNEGGTILNCEGEKVSVVSSGIWYPCSGGIVGYNRGTVKSCNVNILEISAKIVGGIAGKNTSIITGCSFEGCDSAAGENSGTIN